MQEDNFLTDRVASLVRGRAEDGENLSDTVERILSSYDELVFSLRSLHAKLEIPLIATRRQRVKLENRRSQNTGRCWR